MIAMRKAALAISLALLACTVPGAGHAQEACTQRRFEDQPFTVCAADLDRHEIRLFMTQADGSNYSHPEALPREKMLFATNAGMFTPEYRPAGLYVENGVEHGAINTRQGGGNFHVQPNGVFWIKSGVAAVSTTQDYVKAHPLPDYATQSGPMLVIAGAINPKFNDNGPSRYIRNGVGVLDGTHVFFAISDVPVSFGVFARLFRDGLHCANALYLDGSISRLFIPSAPSDRGLPLGPLIGVYERD
jgi:uncharacterized protein YigE (DUF2233 family)